MNDNLLLIAASEAKFAVEELIAKNPEATVEDRLRAAYATTRHHWLVTDEDTRMRAGVGGVLLTCSPEEKARIEAELRALRSFAAAASGIPVDFGALIDEEAPAPIGLMRIWREESIR